jgi:N-acetylmuramoyl-L-alanine amidase
VLLLLAVAWAFAPQPVRAADASQNLWFAGTRLIFDHAQVRGDEIAAGTNDPGLRGFMARVGATIAYEPGERYVVITSADRRTISFSLGDVRFRNGSLGASAPFAPFASGSEAFVPFFALAKALYVEPVALGNETVLQPRIGALDLRVEGKTTYVTLRGATPLRFTRLDSAASDQLSLAFSGVASSLEQSRLVSSAGLGEINVLTSGSPKNPTATVSFEMPPGAVRTLLPSASKNEVSFAFGPAGTTLAGSPIPSALNLAPVVAVAPPRAFAALQRPAVAAVTPAPNLVTPAPLAAAQGAVTPAPAPAATGAADGTAAAAPPAEVTGVEAHGGGETLEVRVSLSGPVAYEWHRLPDQRWYLDLKGATLAIPPVDANLDDTSAATAMRVRQFTKDPIPIVRVSVALSGPRKVELSSTPEGVQIAVGEQSDENAVRVGAGRILPGSSVVADSVAPPPLPVRVAGPTYNAQNPKLIVLDPGHGGSDPGAQRFGMSEKTLTLDIAMRLRDLLVARGWTVKMTRESDVDVFGANASAADELQARCDVANNAGARLFLSIHINSYTDQSLRGTTTYYYKSIDEPLASALQQRMISSLGTADKGVRHNNFYVVRHTTMPAALVETAFISNRGDADQLATPEFRQKVALALADGINDYTRSPMTTSSAAQ